MCVFVCTQVLQEEGLNRYLDPRCLQQEIAEATDMTPDQMDRAARQLLRRPYSHHLGPGGQQGEEMADYDPPRRRSAPPEGSQDSDEDYVDDGSVHVTAL